MFQLSLISLKRLSVFSVCIFHLDENNIVKSLFFAKLPLIWFHTNTVGKFVVRVPPPHNVCE
jgi:hypothetical protein